MRGLRKILLGTGLVAASMTAAATPAHAWYVIHYTTGGFEGYCDNGYMFGSSGNTSGSIDSIEDHTGEPPC